MSQYTISQARSIAISCSNHYDSRLRDRQFLVIYRFCYYKVHNREIAEDITQETFLRFLRGEYLEQGKEMNYLYSIARNLCIDEFRKP